MIKAFKSSHLAWKAVKCQVKKNLLAQPACHPESPDYGCDTSHLISTISDHDQLLWPKDNQDQPAVVPNYRWLLYFNEWSGALYETQKQRKNGPRPQTEYCCFSFIYRVVRWNCCSLCRRAVLMVEDIRVVIAHLHLKAFRFFLRAVILGIIYLSGMTREFDCLRTDGRYPRWHRNPKL